MPDWIGEETAGTAQRYRLMAERELHAVSPSYAAICLGVSGDREILARLDTLPAPKRQPNLLLGAVRFSGGPVSTWAAFREFALDRWDTVAQVMSARRTQTNEPRRCTSLLPVLAALPQPLALLEVGASAGLCLYPDRYGYRYLLPDGDPSGGHRVGEGPELVCTVTGPAPLPAHVPEVTWRAGLDLAPLDVTDPEDVAWLEALIWPEQTDRVATLRAAVEVARAAPTPIVAGDLLVDLPALIAEAPDDATLVVFHSAVLAYVERAGREQFARDPADAATRRPLTWVSNEAPGVVAGTAHVTRSGFVLARDTSPLAVARPHGQTLDWLTPSDAR